uniref:Uncharacterized protein n=1 Tax=Photinus pyralis TaxID=7054 RepID=A0A1Y1L832_PHOPY
MEKPEGAAVDVPKLSPADVVVAVGSGKDKLVVGTAEKPKPTPCDVVGVAKVKLAEADGAKLNPVCGADLGVEKFKAVEAVEICGLPPKFKGVDATDGPNDNLGVAAVDVKPKDKPAVVIGVAPKVNPVEVPNGIFGTVGCEIPNVEAAGGVGAPKFKVAG